MEQLYKKDDVVYCIYDGIIFPVLIDGVFLDEESFVYSINYEKYLGFLEAAKDLGIEDKVPKIDKDYRPVQEDLFSSMQHLQEVASSIMEISKLCFEIENNI